ncbi:MAG: M1 family metallopeptidase [bacterium]|nr:M1 family metallopeptidase [bacterium]
MLKTRCMMIAASILLVAGLVEVAPASGAAWEVAASIRVMAETVPPDDEGKAGPVCAHARAHHAAKTASEDRRQRLASREADADTDVIHYLLELEVIPEYSGQTVTDVRAEGVCTISAESAAPGLSLFTIDLRDNLTVNSVSGNVSSWTRVGHTIEVTLDDTYDSGEAFTVVVNYEGYPDSAGFGAFRWWTRSGNLVVATLSEPFYAHYWWPCKDALDDKSTMEMRVVVPDSMVVVSNGLEIGTEVVAGGRLRYLWHETYAMIPYLASLAITDYQRYDLQYTYDSRGARGTMPVVCYLYPDHWDAGAGQPLPDYKIGCDELPIMLQTLTGRYGDYPFLQEKYGVVETGGGLSASMEHQTISSMSAVANYSDIMLHELAHQWWGDEITCETWNDIWLNEGFASYSESVYREFKPGGGASSYWSRQNYRRPSNPDAQVYRTSTSSVGAIFSGNDVYRKGSWVLHMLRHTLGSDAFFAALADYRAAFQHDSATTAEFVGAISASFGHDLTWFTDQWVMNPGSPRYDWNYAPAVVDGQDYLKLAVWQGQDTAGYGLFTMPIDIRVTTGVGATVFRVWNDQWTEHYVLPLDGPPLDVELDEQDGVSNWNWILFSERAQVATPVQGPPAILSARFTPFAGTNGSTTLELVLSEDIGTFDAADVTLSGALSGSHVPGAVEYTGGIQTALVTYAGLPEDEYTLEILDAGVAANSLLLDGEVDDSAWWDDVLLPSGDGQPGGDAVLTFVKMIGDADADGDIDLDDFALFDACLSGPQYRPYAAGCGVFDFDTDRDVDFADYGALQRTVQVAR